MACCAGRVGEKSRLKICCCGGIIMCRHLGNGAKLVIIKDAGHTPQSEAPRAFNNAVLAFLKDRLPQSRL